MILPRASALARLSPVSMNADQAEGLDRENPGDGILARLVPERDQSDGLIARKPHADALSLGFEPGRAREHIGAKAHH